MTHEDSGHYAAKHPKGTPIDPAIAAALKEKAKDGNISCAAAHKIARQQVASPARVGQIIDLLELRIDKCQLGLFGYHPEKKIVAPSKTASDALESALRPVVTDNRVPCVECWKIADRMDLSRMDVAAACEGLKIKITPCQLGAF
ncbi:MAG: hypothetical protein DSY90_01865 [Deltaproteobacteria bacterium]|nr:MAG: hypothetical protein DSY90_01865 [Deltaproteobacteria bacterium]